MQLLLLWISSVVAKIQSLSSSQLYVNLEAISGFKMELDLVFKIDKDYSFFINAGEMITFC